MSALKTNTIGLLNTSTLFDLAKLKSLFGQPVLLGGEKMKEFDDYANSILEVYEIRDAIMAFLVYNFILETWKRMRLMRHQPRAMQARILQDRSGTPAAARQDREAEATSAMAAKIDLFAQFDYLISEAVKREAILLQQISAYSLALANTLAAKSNDELTRLKLKETKYNMRRLKALDNFLEQRDQEKARKAAADKQAEKKEDEA